MSSVLVVQDRPRDWAAAAEAVRSVGFSGIVRHTSAASARRYLERGLDGGEELPDAIVLDLDLGDGSGSELLRFWHSVPALAKIPLIVWTLLDHQCELCKLFRVTAFVPKEAVSQLREALGQVGASGRGA